MAMKEEVMASDSEEEMPTLVHYNNGFAGLDEEDEQEDEDMAQIVVTNPGGNGASSEDLGVADVLESDEGTSATASDDENGDRSQHHRRRRVMSLEEQIDDFIRSYENVPPPPPDRRTKLDPSLVHPEVMKQLLGCRICKRILDRPVRVAGCCHRFCASCFQRHYSTSKRCPTCSAKIEETNGELAAPCPHYATLVEVFFADARPEVVFSQPEHLALRKRSASRTAHATNGDEMRGGRSPRGSSDTDSSSDGVNEVVNLSDITDSSADDDPPSEELGSWRHISQDSLDFPPLESLLEKEMRLPLNGSIVPRSEMSELSKKVEKRQRKISKFVLRRNLEQKVKGDPDEAGPSSSPKDVTPPPSSARHRRRNRIVFKQTESPFPRPSHETSADSRRYRDYDDDEDEDDDYPDDPSPSNVRTLRRRDHNGVTHSENSEASGRRRAGGAAPSIMQPLRKKQRGDEGEEMPPALLSTANHQDEQSENSGADGDDECEMDDLPSLGRESRYSPAPVYHRLDRSFMNPVIVWPDMHVHNSLIDKDFLLQRFFLLPNEAQIGHLCQAILERLGREHQLKDVDTLLTCRILPVLEEFLIGDLLILDVSSQRAAQALEPVSVVGDTATASASGLQTVNPVSVSLISDDSDSLSSRASTPHTPPPRAANPNSTFITVRYPHEPLNPDTTIEDVVAKYSKANFIPGVLKLVYSITDLVPLT